MANKLSPKMPTPRRLLNVIRVHGPDGRTFHYPASTPLDKINRHLRRVYSPSLPRTQAQKSQTAPPIPAPPTTPTATKGGKGSPLTGGL